MISARRSEAPIPHDVLPDGIRITMFCGVVILTVSSSAALEQALVVFAVLVRSHRTPRLLWDLRGRRLAPLPAQASTELVSRMMREAPRERGGGGRSAFVVSNDHDCKILSALAKDADEAGYGVQLRVFSQDRDALDWLFGRASSSAPSPCEDEPAGRRS